jgi:hypothetical protein
MVRRHRISETEVLPLMRAAVTKLQKLVEENILDRDVEPLFKILWRFKEHRTGPPSYPDINKDTINELFMELQGFLYLDEEEETN